MKGKMGGIQALSIDAFTRDDILMLLSYVMCWDIATGADNKPKLVSDRTSIPAMAIGNTNHCKLKYKLENLLTPKNI